MADGRGIVGLLRVKVTVEKDDVQKPIRGTGRLGSALPAQVVAPAARSNWGVVVVPLQLELVDAG